MRNTLSLTISLALAALCSAASANAASTVTISFDGFCDGMTLTTADGLVGGSLTGCYSGGFALGNKEIAYGLRPLDGFTGVVESVQSTATMASVVLTYYLDFDNNTWANYEATGGLPSLLHQGTFTVTAPDASIDLNAPPSGIGHPNAPPQTLPYFHTATVAFTGYCNGMVLTFSGDLIGGTMTGCSTGAVGGNTGKDFGVAPFAPGESGVAANVGSTENGSGSLTLFILDFANKTVSAFHSTDGHPGTPATATFTISEGSKPVTGTGPPFGY